MVDCRKCQRFGACYFDNEDCIGFEPKTMTNADRIRSMTDIQLAKWVCSVHGTCPRFCPMASDCDGENCDGAWLEWLKKAAEEGK